MTKAEQDRLDAWRLKILNWADGEPRQVARTCRYFGMSRNAFNAGNGGLKSTVPLLRAELKFLPALTIRRSSGGGIRGNAD
jgi:hypothetical protein